MELIASIPLLGGFLTTVFPFLVVLGIVVFVHEYGHYIVGRWCGIHAEVFSLGFGPVLKSWHDKRGTKWQIAAFPLGGYVKFLGDADASSRTDTAVMEQMSDLDRNRSFPGAKVWRRALTVLAGPVANFILSIVIFAAIFSWQGISEPEPTLGNVASFPGAETDLRTGDRILAVNGQEISDFSEIYQIADEMAVPDQMVFSIRRGDDLLEITGPYALPPLVFGVEPLSPASNAGLKQGDYIAKAAGRTLMAFADLRETVLAHGNQTIMLEVIRDGGVLAMPITPLERDIEDGNGGFTKRIMIGVSGGTAYFPKTYTPAPWTALELGAGQVYKVVISSLNGIRSMFMGELSTKNLQGPLGIAQISGETATQGLGSFVTLIAIISTAIGMLNLFPVPVLDGGHLVIFAYEALTGKQPPDRFLQLAMSIGLAMVLLLMLFATYNDIMRWLFVS